MQNFTKDIASKVNESDSELDSFQELFFRDVEKGFSADIVCCDHCFDEFLSTWPYVNFADDCLFQKSSIDLNNFYLGSYLQDYFSKADFDRLICKIDCPECGSPLSENMWLYNFPFDVEEDFKQKINEVLNMAKSKPFLLLDHEFCRRLLIAIRNLALKIVPKKFEHSLFRGQRCNDRPLEKIGDFDFPPKEIVQEGRYNHAGNPVLYIGSDVETCHAELRGVSSVVIEFMLEAEIKVLDLVDSYSKDGGKFEDANLLNLLVHSALVSAKQENYGWYRPNYVVSRLVADCARAAGLDAIKYPSIRRDGKGFNLVILNQNLTLSNFGRVIKFYRCNEI